jgi:RNA polymerase sigma-B factor
MLTNDEVLQLVDTAKNDPLQNEAATEALLDVFSGYIHTIASNRKSDYDDRKQAAVIGLIDAIDRFDPERSDDFKGLLMRCILNAIKKYAGVTERQVSTGDQLYLRYLKARKFLTEFLNRDPSVDELADHVGCTAKTIELLMSSERCISISKETISGRELSTYIPDDVERDPLQQVLDIENHELKSALYEEMLSHVPEAAQKRLHAYLVEGRSCADIAAEEGVTRQAVHYFLGKVFHDLKCKFKDRQADFDRTQDTYSNEREK